MRRISLYLLALVACLAAAPAQSVTLDVDFTGNVLPAGWTQSSIGGAGIRNERMESEQINQTLTIEHALFDFDVDRDLPRRVRLRRIHTRRAQADEEESE